ncbi:hypothetical protein Tco_1223217 [Tanacetum coccineum]
MSPGNCFPITPTNMSLMHIFGELRGNAVEVSDDDDVAHVLDDDDVEVSDDDEVNPSTNVEEVLSSDDSDDDN